MALLHKAKFALDLLDSAQGHPVQTWNFDDQPIIRISRQDDSDVTIVDPRVSRLHAELELRPVGWLLISRGRNGVYVDGKMVVEELLSDKQTFQLGASGPLLRFRQSFAAAHNVTTIDSIDPSLFDALKIDQEKKENEVQEIVGGKLFQQLKQQAEQLRRRNEQGK